MVGIEVVYVRPRSSPNSQNLLRGNGTLFFCLPLLGFAGVESFEDLLSVIEENCANTAGRERFAGRIMDSSYQCVHNVTGFIPTDQLFQVLYEYI